MSSLARTKHQVVPVAPFVTSRKESETSWRERQDASVRGPGHPGWDPPAAGDSKRRGTAEDHDQKLQDRHVLTGKAEIPRPPLDPIADPSSRVLFESSPLHPEDGEAASRQ